MPKSQSGDDTEKPTAVARLYLEDGTVLTGLSFGSHKSAEGEVRTYISSSSISSNIHKELFEEKEQIKTNNAVIFDFL